MNTKSHTLSVAVSLSLVLRSFHSEKERRYRRGKGRMRGEEIEGGEEERGEGEEKEI